ncbi:MAG: hypothetical protein Q9O62_03455 [Ardenticatenia bacterium]|nr:hypothetical protein [Ardenticatenia bacterium]
MNAHTTFHDHLLRARLSTFLWHAAGTLFLMALTSACARAPQAQDTAHAVANERTPAPSIRADELSKALKIYVDRPGIYRLDAQSGGVGTALPWDRMRLTFGEQELPLLPLDGGEGVLFYVPPLPPDRYAREAVIWATFDAEPPTLMEDVQPPPSGEPTQRAFLATVQAEENLVYQPLAGGHDPWFWAQVTAPSSWETTLELDNVVPQGEATLRVELWAKTKAPVNPDHHWRLVVNGQQVADITRDGEGSHVLEVTLPATLLREGPNTVRLDAVDDLGVVDIGFVNRLLLTYPRAFVAHQNRLTFKSEGGLHRVSGFTAPPLVFDITNPLAPAGRLGCRRGGQ